MSAPSHEVALAILAILVWGVLATIVMTAVMFISQHRGWSRLNVPFLLGTLFTGDRHAANILGFLIYLFAGCLLAFIYYLVFATIGRATWWLGGLVGIVHGMLLLTVFLPVLAYMHPRVASEYDGASTRKRLEPPGFMALNYGYRTPLVATCAQAAYGLVLGAGFGPFF